MPRRSAHQMTRRAFTRTALTAAGALAVPGILRGQDSTNKLKIAMIGVGGRGVANLKGVASEDIVILCDVNQKAIDAAAVKYRHAKTFTDFRKVFDHAADFDAVVVSTCEHTHAFATMLALKHHKHVYCEKQLTYNIWEARRIREAAAKTKVTTQMGIQMHATENYRRVVELIWANAIGPVSEVHVWVSRAWGRQSAEAAQRYKDIVTASARPKDEN